MISFYFITVYCNYGIVIITQGHNYYVSINRNKISEIFSNQQTLIKK